jgi:hypothetical protein
MITGYRDGKLIAPISIQGAYGNHVYFEIWLKSCPVPTQGWAMGNYR